MTTIAIVIAIPLVKFLKLLNSGEGLKFKGRIADDDRLRNRNPRFPSEIFEIVTPIFKRFERRNCG